MTKKLYWDISVLEAHVEVLTCQELGFGCYALQLSVTPFHPKGSGQSSDVGWIGDAGVTCVEIESGEIIHYTDRRVPLGIVTAKVNAEPRLLHSKLHSVGHLVGHAMEPLDWIPIKAHHWPGEARVLFKPRGAAQVIDAKGVQSLCEQLISQDLPCKISIRENQYREVGFGDLTPYSCGGTHMTSTADLKDFHVLSAQIKKGQLTIYYDIKVTR